LEIPNPGKGGAVLILPWCMKQQVPQGPYTQLLQA